MITRWRVPDKDELNQMYEILHKNGIGGFANVIYWSSSENNAYNAWYQYFYNGYRYYYFKNTTLRVRAVRDFTSSTIYQLKDKSPSGGWIFYKNGNHYKECKDIDESKNMNWINATRRFPPILCIERLAITVGVKRDEYRKT